jgi:uncharacterized protein YfdQ (DUF2303 family)
MTTEVKTIADLAVAASGKPETIVTEGGREFLITPDGLKVQEVTEPGAKLLPDHIVQGVTLQTVDSIVDYAERFKTDTSVLFADIEHNTIVAAIDYHAPAAAGHVQHSAKMALPHSVEWKAWAGINGKMMEQLEFARFLEENAADIEAPSGADVLEACRDLQARRKVNFIKAVRTSSDNENFEFTDETEARTKGGVELPAKFKLSIPVYFDDAPHELFAFLRWRLDDGSLKLGIALHRAEHVRQAVFKSIVTDVAERTALTAVFGRLNA